MFQQLGTRLGQLMSSQQFLRSLLLRHQVEKLLISRRTTVLVEVGLDTE